MKRNLLLFLAILVTFALIFSSVKRIMTFNSTAQKVEDEEAKLERLRVENEELKRELEYKKSQRFVEEEIRNKLGMAKEGEQVFVVPSEEENGAVSDEPTKQEIPNWRKWQILIFGEG